jgi:predicted dehydrogenase
MSGSSLPLSIGIVGAGEISRKAHLPVLVNVPDVRIAWIYDRRPASARALAEAYGLRAIDSSSLDSLADCDVALLAIPVEARGEYLAHFSSRGKAALCEKPFARSPAEHIRFLQQFAPHSLGAGYMRRFYRSTRLLRRVVREGLFGQLLNIDLREGSRSKGSGTDASFLDDPRLGRSRGVLTDLGSHSIDLALYVSGASSFGVVSVNRTLDGDVDRRLAAAVKLHLPGRRSDEPVEFNYVVSWLDRQDNRIQLTFERATVWSGLEPASEVLVGDPDSPRDALVLSAREGGAATYNQAFYLEWRDFLAGVRDERESEISARSALVTTSLVEALLTEESHSRA